MNLLITYASNSGGTHLAAKQIRDTLLSKVNKITLKKAKDTKNSDFDKNDLIIIGTPTWLIDGEQGKPHETIIDLIKRLKDKDLADKKFAVFGCGDSSYIQFCGAVDKLDEFVKQKNGAKLIDSLKIDGYFFDLENNIKLIDLWIKKLTQNFPITSII